MTAAAAAASASASLAAASTTRARLARLGQRVAVAHAAVARAEGAYQRERALSEASTWGIRATTPRHANHPPDMLNSQRVQRPVHRPNHCIERACVRARDTQVEVRDARAAGGDAAAQGRRGAPR